MHGFMIAPRLYSELCNHLNTERALSCLAEGVGVTYRMIPPLQKTQAATCLT